jgi:hypothetical protein
MPEYAAQGGPIKLNQAAGPSNLIVRFYSRTIPMMRLGQRVHDCTETEDRIELRHAGENLQVVDRVVRDSDKTQFPMQWQRYQEGKEQKPDGIPLNLLFPSNPGIVRALEAQSIFTVQQLANLSTHGIESIGMGAQTWVNSAVRYMEHINRGVDTHRFETTIQELEEHNAELNRQVIELRQTVDQLLKALPVKAATNA